ncbi:hypothetical protein [Actinomadura sp. 9N407]|uniref:hypothetical protein n=1 Tax=Actinomadura sp. 9N407 TaxID=3375154 RepID=UPI0037A10CF9
MKMKSIHIAEAVTAVVLIAGGTGACGADEPATPPQPSQSPVESPPKPREPSHVESSPATPDKPKPQEPSQSPDRESQDTDTDNRPLPEECKHPPGGSVRQGCIEEFGPDGVGTVQPVPPERDRNDNGIDDSVEEPEPEPPQDSETEPTQDEEQVPSTEEQIEQCTEQTGSPEACREKIDS